MAVSHRLVADDSAPLPGAVLVGHDDEHQHYIANAYENRNTCAVVNQKCVTNVPPPPCRKINSTDSTNHVAVFDGVFDPDVSLIASSVCLPGFWISNYSSVPDIRYEWSVGMKGHDPGFGIFDPIIDKMWFDVEVYDRGVYCLPSTASPLLNGEYYSFYSRVWHGFSNYTTYQSNGWRRGIHEYATGLVGCVVTEAMPHARVKRIIFAI